MSELNRELVTTSAQRAAAQSRLADLEAARASNRLDSLNSVLDSRLIQQLGEQAALVSGQVAEMSAQHGAEYPKLVEALAHLRDLRARIGTEVDKVAATYRSDLAVGQAKETSLRKMVAAAVMNVLQINPASESVDEIVMYILISPANTDDEVRPVAALRVRVSGEKAPSGVS
jgi:uncharacterized protein involved in exopolysaccharide biosynthesis